MNTSNVRPVKREKVFVLEGVKYIRGGGGHTGFRDEGAIASEAGDGLQCLLGTGRAESGGVLQPAKRQRRARNVKTGSMCANVRTAMIY